ncbi:MAG: glycosyltransferase family 2 protein [Flavobacteriales bacterium]|nr:glycosyltransferase family 2 protein [Flavobacteriales bacterium]
MNENNHSLTCAVVILNWNGRELLERFLPSVVKNTPSWVHIYVADNASTDDSLAYLAEHFPAVGIIKNDANYGFATGYNKALKGLTEDVFALVNSDIEVTQGWIEPLIKEFEEHSDVVAAQPRLLDYKDKKMFEYAGAAGGFIDKYGYPYCRGRIFTVVEEDHSQYEQDSDIFWATGACLLVRRGVFEVLGGFDDDFFAHLEEIDLCWRILNSGGRIRYIASSKVYHVGGATLKKYDARKTYLNFRNSLFSLVKNLPAYRIPYVVFVRLVLDGVQGLRFLCEKRPRHTWALVRAHWGFYTHFITMWRKRSLTPAKTRKYYHTDSIVFRHFLCGKKYFSDL